ncbi:MAG TPA: DUF502 domain-containing protein [Planctomycetota bacterium]|nr:DUF502 domain-containing protein [Planctomycetota bacterium]
MTDNAPEPVTSEKPRSDWKRFFLRGLALLLPTVLTVLILVKAYQFIDAYLIRYVNLGVAAVLQKVGFYDAVSLEPGQHWVLRYLVLVPVRWFFDYAFGFVVSILFIYALGLFIGTIVGRRLWHGVESRLMRFPVVRTVYPFIRQVTDFIFREHELAFRRVVAIEYPRKGVWAMGFLTGRGFSGLRERAADDLVTVFIPSSPTPMTGYVVLISEREVVPLDMTVEQAFRMIISGGVIKPEDRAGLATTPPKREIEAPADDPATGS